LVIGLATVVVFAVVAVGAELTDFFWGRPTGSSFVFIGVGLGLGVGVSVLFDGVGVVGLVGLVVFFAGSSLGVVGCSLVSSFWEVCSSFCSSIFNI